VLPLAAGLDQGTPWLGATFGPPTDLGHPVEPSVWVAGRGLSRKRPGIISVDGRIEHAGPSLVLAVGQTLTFPEEPLPGDGAPVDLVVTLSRSKAGPDRRLQVLVDDAVVHEFEVPPERKGSWQSEPLPLPPPAGPLVRIGVRLVGDPGAEAASKVWLRDLGLFSRGVEHPSVLAGAATLPRHDPPDPPSDASQG